MPTMTVYETCSYYATLLLPRGYSSAVRRERMEEVLAAMGLSHTMGTLVSAAGWGHDGMRFDSSWPAVVAAAQR